jgi:hypothetical protein
LRLVDVCELQMGYTARERLEPSESGVPAIQLRDIPSVGEIAPDRLSLFALEGEVGRYLVRSGDVVFRSRGDRNTAHVIGADFRFPAVAILPLIILRPDRSRIEPAYLAWVLNQAPAQKHFHTKAEGTSLRMVPRSSFDSLDIDIPSPDEQRAIVEADALAEKERMLATSLAEKRRLMTSLILVDRARNTGPDKGRKGKDHDR